MILVKKYSQKRDSPFYEKFTLYTLYNNEKFTLYLL